MTDISNQAYVRTEMLGEQPAPIANVGIIGWMRQNLFSSPMSAVLTILGGIAIYFVLAALLPWTFGGIWNATSLAECRLIVAESLGEGETAHRACWGVIHERFWHLMYGFYPSDSYWRPNLALVLLFVAIAPVLFNGLPKAMFIISFAALFICPWLLWGGPVWTPIVAALGFVIGYLVVKFVSPLLGSLTGLIIGVLAALVWWLFFAGMVSQGITHMIASSRMDGEAVRLEKAIPEQKAKVAELSAIVEPLEAQLADIQAKIDAVVAAGVSAENPVSDLVRQKTPVKMALNAAVAARNKADIISKNMVKRQKSIGSLSFMEGKLAELTQQAKEARAALPATVADFDSLNEVTEELRKTIPAEDIDLLAAALKVNEQKTNLDITITRLYEEVGLFGLKPVPSRNFGGFMLAILLGITGIVLSFPMGIILALGRLSNLMIVKSMCVGFIEFIRGVPLITLLFVASALLNYFLPKGTQFDIILRVMIMITIFSAAYMAEVIRGGLAALPKGQYEAADALGLDYWQAQRLIIMPQALKISIPGIVSTFIGLFKDTTLVSIIALSDPIGWVKLIQSKTEWNGIIWELYGFVALVFFLFCFGMSRYSMYLERKLQTGH